MDPSPHGAVNMRIERRLDGYHVWAPLGATWQPVDVSPTDTAYIPVIECHASPSTGLKPDQTASMTPTIPRNQREHNDISADQPGPAAIAPSEILANEKKSRRDEATVSDMVEGEAAYIRKWGMWVDAEHRCWLHPDYPVRPIPSATATMRIERRRDGYHVWAPLGDSTWEPVHGPSYISPTDTSYIPVIERHASHSTG